MRQAKAVDLCNPPRLSEVAGGPFGTVLADPPWRFQNRTGKVAPEHRRLSRYDTMDWKDIAALDVGSLMAEQPTCFRRAASSQRGSVRIRREPS